MRISDVMVKDPVKVDPDTSIREVARIMRDRSIGSVILVKDDKPVGIVTERDLVRRALASVRNLDSMKAFDISSKPVATTSELADVDLAIDIMNDYKIRRLVIINEENKVVGILTTDDIWHNFRRLSEELASKYMVLSRRK